MPTTGVAFDQIVDRKSDNAYSGYFDPVEKNQIVKEATILHIDFLFGTNDKARIRDDLFSLFKTGTPIIPINNTVNLVSGITDYNHFMDGLADMVDDFTNISRTGLNIVAASNTATSPIKVTFDKELNLRSGEKVRISGVVGKTGCNGIRYVLMLNTTQAFLYSDPKLLVPVIDLVPYISGGTVSRIVSTWVQENDQKTAKLAEASLYYTKFEVANGLLKILPLDIVCENILIDYISKPTVFIDVTDNVIDLELQYSLRCINDIANKVCELMGYSDRDVPLSQESQEQLLRQP